MRTQLIAILAITCFFNLANAMPAQGLTIHATEIGVGKFHRYDNLQHAYPAGSVWTPYILPVDAPLDKTTFQKNFDGSYTIFFLTLEDMITTTISIAQSSGTKVSLLNIHGHGLPGGMWFPWNKSLLGSLECQSWQRAATGDDKENYSQYYTLPSADEIQDFRNMGDAAVDFGCTSGLKEWHQLTSDHPEFKLAMADDLQVHFLSCLVGLGNVGDSFIQGLTKLLINTDQGRVEASMNFGLGDWSMPQGMGFWDYTDDQQLANDSEAYIRDRKDAEVAQKGSIRVGHTAAHAVTSGKLDQQSYLPVSFELALRTQISPSLKEKAYGGPLPLQIRVPGTNQFVQVVPKKDYTKK